MNAKKMMADVQCALCRPTVSWRICADAALQSERGADPLAEFSLKSNKEFPLFSVMKVLFAIVALCWFLGMLKKICHKLFGK